MPVRCCSRTVLTSTAKINGIATTKQATMTDTLTPLVSQAATILRAVYGAVKTAKLVNLGNRLGLVALVHARRASR